MLVRLKIRSIGHSQRDPFPIKLLIFLIYILICAAGKDILFLPLFNLLLIGEFWIQRVRFQVTPVRRDTAAIAIENYGKGVMVR